MSSHGPNRNPFDDLADQIDLEKLGRTLLFGLPIVIILVGIMTSYYTVGPEGKAVIKRFGRVVGTQGPGLHFKLPFWIDQDYFVATERIHKEEFGFRTIVPGQHTAYDRSGDFGHESLMLTGDLNVIDVQWVVQYRISDPDVFLHRLRNQRETIRVISESVMRRIVGNRLGSDVLTVGRVEISSLAEEAMQHILNDYDMGIHITAVELKDVTPPGPVKASYNEVNEARQKREQLINEAERMRNKAIPRAKGNSLKMIAQAEGYAAERTNHALGEAARFKAIYKEYRQAPQVTRQRLYLETIDTIMPKVGKVYVIDKNQTTPIPLLNLGAESVLPLGKANR